MSQTLPPPERINTAWRILAATIPIIFCNAIGYVGMTATSLITDHTGKPFYGTELQFFLIWSSIITVLPLALAILLSESMVQGFRTKVPYIFWLPLAWICVCLGWIYVSSPEQYWHYDKVILEQAAHVHNFYLWAMVVCLLLSFVFLALTPKLPQKPRLATSSQPQLTNPPASTPEKLPEKPRSGHM